jgi:hypothetical protein
MPLRVIDLLGDDGVLSVLGYDDHFTCGFDSIR